MKKLLLAVPLLLSATSAFAGDVSVSIGVNQPGFYGQITLGDYPRPSVIYAEPMIIERGPTYIEEPLYLHVPPGHERHWRQHCAEYHACGRRVYFVRDDWYRNEYARRQEHAEHRRDERRDDRRDDHRVERRDDHRAERRDDHHPDGRDHDNGHGHGHDKDRGDDRHDDHRDDRHDNRDR